MVDRDIRVEIWNIEVTQYQSCVDNDSDGVCNCGVLTGQETCVTENCDCFPNDATESVDTDGNGIGDNTDTDDDGDGVLDTADDYPLDNSKSVATR